MLKLYVRFHVFVVAAGRGPSPIVSGDRGQTTAEYALVLLGVAALALLVLAWAAKTDRIGKLFDFVLDQIVGRVK